MTSVGSIYFPGTHVACLQVPQTEELQLMNDDFTIEWFQYMVLQPFTVTPCIFAIGTYPNVCIGAYVDRYSVFHLLLNGCKYAISRVTVYDTWTHFAIVRHENIFRVYANGEQISEDIHKSCNLDYNHEFLTIGNESIPSRDSVYTGYITNLRIIRRNCIYSSAFSVPTYPLPVTNDTSFLLYTQSAELMCYDRGRFEMHINVNEVNTDGGEYNDSLHEDERVIHWTAHTPST